MAVALSPNELERTIEVLSSAGQTLQLTRFGRLSYRALLLSVDGLLTSFIFFNFFVLTKRFPVLLRGNEEFLIKVVLVVFGVSSLVGAISLALNIPLLFRTFREERRLKRLGLGSLSKSLWKESRRSRWINRIRGILVIGVGLYSLGEAADMFRTALTGTAARENLIGLFVTGICTAIIVASAFVARYLRNQRERMDLASNAGELRKALVSLRQRKGSEVVSVPAELLEQTARIEAAQISNERRDAVLQSAASRSNDYAVAFNREATRQRSTLGAADRIELEDLVAELSTKGAQLGAPAQAIPGTEGTTLPRKTKSKRVEIEYTIDHASRGIRVTAVRHGAEASDASLNGASNA